MRRDWYFWAGAALQIVLFQLIVWAVLAGERPLGLTLAAVAVAALQFLLYRRRTSQ